MSRCGCSGSTCACVVTGGGGVTVSGAGTQSNPYVISAGTSTFGVSDTGTIDLTLTGSGTSGDPYALTAALQPLPTTGLSNWAGTAPTNGQVPIWNSGTGKWTPGPAATASPGAINVGNSLVGDGSAGSPLNVKPNATTGRLITTASGLDMGVDAGNRLNLQFANAAARNAAIGAPGQGMSVWLVDVGYITVYDGSVWRPIYLEVGKSWMFLRSSANSADNYTGTLSVLTGSIVSAMPGRYLMIGTLSITQAAGFTNGSILWYVGGVLQRSQGMDTYGPYTPHSDIWVFSHAGGTFNLEIRHLNNGASNSISRDGSFATMVYLGKF